jgi:hypothetical protein
MTQTTYTPGPWTIRRLTNGWPRVTSDTHDICDLMLNGNGLPHVEANARLIAAATALLQSAQAALAYLTAHGIDLDGEEEVLVAGIRLELEEAIAQATGTEEATL